MTEKEMIEKVKELVEDAVWTDGGHHKQWYLCQIGEILECDFSDSDGYILDDNDRGCAP